MVLPSFNRKIEPSDWADQSTVAPSLFVVVEFVNDFERWSVRHSQGVKSDTNGVIFLPLR